MTSTRLGKTIRIPDVVRTADNMGFFTPDPDYIPYTPNSGFVKSNLSTKIVGAMKMTEEKIRKNHLVALLQKDYTTVEVAFGIVPSTSNGMKKSYTYKVPYSYELEIENLVVVPVPHGFSIGAVVGIDATPQIDLDSGIEYKWIVQKVDSSSYDSLILKEREFLASLEAIEKEKRKAEAFEDFKKFLPADSLPLLDSAIAKLNSVE